MQILGMTRVARQCRRGEIRYVAFEPSSVRAAAAVPPCPGDDRLADDDRERNEKNAGTRTRGNQNAQQRSQNHCSITTANERRGVAAFAGKQKAPAHPPRPFVDRESPILRLLER